MADEPNPQAINVPPVPTAITPVPAQPSVIQPTTSPSPVSLLQNGPKKERQWFKVLGIVLILALVILAGWFGYTWFSNAQLAKHPTLGLALKPGPTSSPQGINQTTALNGSCISSYIIQADGVLADGTFHYLVTASLSSSIDSTTAFYSLMATKSCGEETKSLLTLIQKDPVFTKAPQSYSLSYRGANGYRYTPGV